MKDKSAASEFAFLRDRIHRISQLLVDQERYNLIEVSFILGCLHTICCENVEKFSDDTK